MMTNKMDNQNKSGFLPLSSVEKHLTLQWSARGTLYEIPFLGMILIIVGLIFYEVHPGYIILVVCGALLFMWPLGLVPASKLKDRLTIRRRAGELERGGFVTDLDLRGNRSVIAIFFDLRARRIAVVNPHGSTEVFGTEELQQVGLSSEELVTFGTGERTTCYDLVFICPANDYTLSFSSRRRALRHLRKVRQGLGHAVPIRDFLSAQKLIKAARENKLRRVRRLLKKGFDVNARDKYSTTPLSYASYAGHLNVVRLLLENGANVNAKTEKGSTAIIEAAYSGNPVLVGLLVENGAEIDAKTEFGRTALMAAAVCGHTAVVKLLLEQGCDTDAKDSEGRTAFKHASEMGHKEVEDLLSTHMTTE